MCMDETMALIESAHAGDKGARDRLVTDNMGLVWSIVKRFTGRGHEPEDLFQIGAIGLIKAIDKFDLTYDVKFSTYAVPMIVGEIKRFIRDDGMLKVSRSLKELAARARGVREELSAVLGREPTVEELAGHMGICTEELAAALDSGTEVESLYKTIYHGEGNDICLMDRLEEERNGQEEVINRVVLDELLGQLEPQARQLIVMRYYQELTQTQIAGRLGISQVQVSRLEKKILKTMRDKLYGK
jgi:RNA polymerase sporulation-specific sigma factor